MKFEGMQAGLKDLEDISRALVSLSDELKKIINNGIVWTDNLDSVKVEHTFTTVDTEEEVAITLGRVPVGFTVTSIDEKAIIYESGSTHTQSILYLKASATCTVTLYVF